MFVINSKVLEFFFCGSSAQFDSCKKKRNLHLLAWDKVCRPEVEGGIGFTSLKIRNISLLYKWSYNWYSERSRSWNKWIRSKYNCAVEVD